MNWSIYLSSIAIILLLSCSSSFKDGYNLEVDQAYDAFEVPSDIREGSSLSGSGEAIEGLLRIAKGRGITDFLPVLYAITPEDSYIRVVQEDRYSGGRLAYLELEIRFYEETKVKMMMITEDFRYSTPDGETSDDLNKTKRPEDGGPYALVNVSYGQTVSFAKFSSKVKGEREYYEDPERRDYFFRDNTYGVQENIKEFFTQASYSQGAGLFTRMLTLNDASIAGIVKSYQNDGLGNISGILSGDLSGGVILQGTFNIATQDTKCVLDDTGAVSYVITYPQGDDSGKETESFDVEMLDGGISNLSSTLKNTDGSTETKDLHRVVTRPAGCDESLIRNTATITGTDYAGSAVNLSEVKVQKLTHLYGTITAADEKVTNVDIYRVSGQAVYR